MISTTMMWLTGWGMSDEVFDRLRELLPDFHHVSVKYYEVDSPEGMLLLTESIVRNFLSSNETAPAPIGARSKVLICGWSLGGLLALKLAAKGYGDGLVLFGANARFTRSREELDLGWLSASIRQMISGLKKNRQIVETEFYQSLFTEAERSSGLGDRLPRAGSWTITELIAGLQLLRDEEALSSLSSIDCPVLVVHGTADPICPYPAAIELLQGLRQAELLAVPDCGHVPFLDKEDETANKLRRWWHDQGINRYFSSI